MTDRTRRTVGRYSPAAAVTWAVLAPLLALAYFATPPGAESLEVATTAAWAEPARNIAGPLLTFASPDGVYSVYTFLLALLFPSIVLGALVARSRRPAEQTHPERWGWRLAIGGYALFGAGLGVVAVIMLIAGPSASIVDALFMATMVPGLLVALIGSTILGISLLRAGYRPRTTAWLLALALPLWMVGSAVLGHNALGILPLAMAWAIAAPDQQPAPVVRAQTA